MLDSDSEAEPSDEDVDVDLAMFGKKKKKKEKKEDKKDGKKEDKGDGDEKKKKNGKDVPADDNETAVFGEKKKKSSKEKSGKEKKPVPIVGEVLESSPVPRKDKLRLCKVKTGDATTVSIVTNAPNVAVGRKFIVALPGVTTASGIEVSVAKVGGVESSACFAAPMRWVGT